MDSFEEGLGRIGSVARPLEFERPFLAPLHRFLTLHPRGSTRSVPADVSFILRYLASQLRRQRHYNCESRRTRHELMLRPVWKGLESEVGNRSKTGMETSILDSRLGLVLRPVVKIGHRFTNGMISLLWLFPRRRLWQFSSP